MIEYNVNADAAHAGVAGPIEEAMLKTAISGA